MPFWPLAFSNRAYVKGTFGPFSGDRNFNPLVDVPGVAGDWCYIGVVAQGVAINQTMTGWTQIGADLHVTSEDDGGVKGHYKTLDGSETDFQVVHNSTNVWVTFAVLIGGVSGLTPTIVDADTDATEGAPTSDGTITLADDPAPSLAVALYGFHNNTTFGSTDMVADDAVFTGATPDVNLSDLTGNTQAILKATLFTGAGADVVVDLADIGGTNDIQCLQRFGVYWA